MNLIEPRTLKGFRDFLPADALTRQKIIRTIVETYETFGFLPLETPAMEYADVLTGKYGDEGEKLMYRFKDQGGRDVALRYDLTVPLARVVAQYQELPKPFRRYQIAPVWRAENTQKGRFREFTQCDFDIVGSASMLADAEVAQIIAMVLKNLGFDKFVVRINNRKLLNGILDAAGVPDKEWNSVIRSLDKWAKLGMTAVRVEAQDRIGEKLTEKLFALLPKDKNEEQDFLSWQSRVGKMVKKYSQGAAGLDELQQVQQALTESQSIRDFVQTDVLLARGLDYYTGTIFEAALTNKPEIGSVYGGGRYDELIGQFIGTSLPAVGASAGVDRLLSALKDSGTLDARTTTADVLVAMFDGKGQTEAIRLANELRAAGVRTELFYEPATLGKQFKYADKLGIPYVVLYGDDEQQRSEVTVKDLARKEQTSFPRNRIGDILVKLLSLGKPLSEFDRERFLRGD